MVAGSMYALGDCCANPANPLPPLAQVAEQQGKYLAQVLNDMEAQVEGGSLQREFRYRSLGAMATLGAESAVMELHLPEHAGKRTGLSFSGFFSWLAWRSAYLTRLGPFRNRLYVMVNWSTSMLFGRDVSRW
mmetsp:Transcript_17718/g.49590  ORF Transcript_17718/g.49590 Transcript_17718/m.49590 type:complete len:132 (+) Transcript_17718:107-502(+)